MVETVDFFPPIVDDPYLYGAIAAANSMSDVYAMGGRVIFALAVAGFPRDFPKEVIAEIFRGGADKVAEAGGVVAGGHTVVDTEPKYGLCVTGLVHPKKLLVKGGLRPGDRLFLSKRLGTGVIATAAKADDCAPEVLDGAIRSMLRLNRVASEIAQELGARGATDITGFGLLGHASEMVEGSKAGIRLDAAAIPILDGAVPLAEKGHLSGGMKRNRRHVEATLESSFSVGQNVPPAVVNLLFESETSGGLFFGIEASRAAEVVSRFQARGEPCWQVGEVTEEREIRIV